MERSGEEWSEVSGGVLISKTDINTNCVVPWRGGNGKYVILRTIQFYICALAHNLSLYRRKIMCFLLPPEQGTMRFVFSSVLDYTTERTERNVRDAFGTERNERNKFALERQKRPRCGSKPHVK